MIFFFLAWDYILVYFFVCSVSLSRSSWVVVMQHPNFETRHPLQTDEQQETGFDPLNNFNKNHSSMSAFIGSSVKTGYRSIGVSQNKLIPRHNNVKCEEMWCVRHWRGLWRPGPGVVFVPFCLHARGGMMGVGVRWSWWIFMPTVPVDWSTPVTNFDRQLSDLNTRSPAGQIRLITANKEQDEWLLPSPSLA